MSHLPVLRAQTQLHRLEQRPAMSLANDDRRHSMLEADNDLTAIHEYLITKCKKPTTYKAMVGAIRKLLVFMQLNDLQSLRDFKLLHCSQFQDWLMDIDGMLSKDADRLIYSADVKGRPVFWLAKENRPNPAWRPFRKPMNEVTAQQTLNRVNTLFQWLCNAHYLTGNPWKITDKVSGKKRITEIGSGETMDKLARALPSEVLAAIRHYLDHGADFDDDANGLGTDAVPLTKLPSAVFARRRWFFYFYYYTAARVSSGLNATLDDIYNNDDDQVMLRLIVKGQGVKLHPVPWIEELESEYHRYRASIRLPAESVTPALSPPAIDRPIQHDLGPRHLILPLGLKTYDLKPTALSYSALYYQIDQLFIHVRRWVERHPELGLTPKHKRQLESASSHWVRHGTANLMGPSAKDQLGHAHESTTQEYQTEKRAVQIARLKSMSDDTVDDERFFELLEADDDTKRRWIAVLEDSLSK